MSTAMLYNDFNIVTGKPTTLQELAEIVIKLNDSESNIEYKGGREYDVERFYGDYSKAEKYLGYKPEIDLEQGIKASILMLM